MKSTKKPKKRSEIFIHGDDFIIAIDAMSAAKTSQSTKPNQNVTTTNNPTNNAVNSHQFVIIKDGGEAKYKSQMPILTQANCAIVKVLPRVVVTKKQGNAVIRNKIKRRLLSAIHQEFVHNQTKQTAQTPAAQTPAAQAPTTQAPTTPNMPPAKTFMMKIIAYKTSQNANFDDVKKKMRQAMAKLTHYACNTEAKKPAKTN